MRARFLALLSAAWLLLSVAPLQAGTLSTEIDGIKVELVSKPSEPRTKGWLRLCAAPRSRACIVAECCSQWRGHGN